MSKQELARRFRSHANLPGGEAGFVGLGMTVWAWRRKGSALSIEAQVGDFVTSLQALNVQPRTVDNPRFSDAPSRDIAYSVSCVLAELAKSLRSDRGRTEVEARQQLEWALEAAAHAWSQYLAGDIEDLVQDLRDNGLWKDAPLAN